MRAHVRHADRARAALVDICGWRPKDQPGARWIGCPPPVRSSVRVEATPINPSDLRLLFGPADMDTLKVEAGGRAATAQVPAQRLASVQGRLGRALPVGNEGAGTIVRGGTRVQHLIGRKVAMSGGGMYAQLRRLVVLRLHRASGGRERLPKEPRSSSILSRRWASSRPCGRRVTAPLSTPPRRPTSARCWSGICPADDIPLRERGPQPGAGRTAARDRGEACGRLRVFLSSQTP